MLAHRRCAFAYLRYRRIGEGVEQVVFVQNQLSLYTFRVDVIIWFEWPLGGFTGGRRKASPGKGKLWLCYAFGGVILLRRYILCEGSEGLRGT